VKAIYRALIDPLLAPLVRRAQRGRHSDGPAVPTGLGLALGGGFARGFAHLGVLQVLEESHVPISCIAGTSVGSILGAAYAAGVPLARIMAVCRNIRFKDFARWRISRLGLASNDRMADLVRDVFDAQTFESLLIPMAVLATDLGTGEPVVFRHGSLVDAIRASCAFPGLFEPVRIGTRCLADGGLVAPVPTQAAREMGADCVIGVSVGFNNWNAVAPSNLFQIVARSISAVQKHQTQSWESYADLILQPDIQTIDWDEFARADEAIAAGVSVTRQALPRIWALLEKSAESVQEAETISSEPGSTSLEEVMVR
jgi:NTE family protein